MGGGICLLGVCLLSLQDVCPGNLHPGGGWSLSRSGGLCPGDLCLWMPRFRHPSPSCHYNDQYASYRNTLFYRFNTKNVILQLQCVNRKILFSLFLLSSHHYYVFFYWTMFFKWRIAILYFLWPVFKGFQERTLFGIMYIFNANHIY